MPPNKEAGPSAGPVVVSAADSTSRHRGEPFVVVPLRYRQEHANWSNAEIAAHLDLLMVSYSIGGIFETIEVARAYLRGRAGALDALIEREAFVETDRGWQLSDYVELYDESKRLRPYLPNAERVADAQAKLDRGEPITEAERKALQRAKRPESETEEDENKSKRDRPDKGPDTSQLPQLGNLYEAFAQLTGLPCTAQDRARIDSLCRDFDRDEVRRAMYADPRSAQNPDKFIGRVFYALKEGVAA